MGHHDYQKRKEASCANCKGNGYCESAKPWEGGCSAFIDQHSPEIWKNPNIELSTKEKLAILKNTRKWSNQS